MHFRRFSKKVFKELKGAKVDKKGYTYTPKESLVTVLDTETVVPMTSVQVGLSEMLSLLTIFMFTSNRVTLIVPCWPTTTDSGAVTCA